ncbi:MAG: hypothetical protein ACJATI_001768 [Halioglobus sp.]
MITGMLIYAGIFDDRVGISVGRSSFGIVDREFASALSPKDYGKVIIAICIVILFIKTIYHLRKATLKMIKGEMFDQVVSENLKWTGISMILYKVSSLIGNLYSEVLYQNQFTVGFDFGGFESFIFILILGLFFILLSNVIKNGITLKSENDLTI